MTHQEKAIALDDIILDARCQARVALDQPTVDAYTDLYRDEVEMPPLDVFEVDGVPYLIDGFHRLAALKQIGESFVRVRVVGSSNEIQDATKAALSANHEHGLRRTREDRRRCVELALEAELYEDLGSNRAMAKELGVSEGVVRKVRAEWEAKQSAADSSIDEGAYVRTDTEDSHLEEPTDNDVQQKPKKAKPSPFEAFRKNVEHVERDVPKFFEAGSEAHEVALRLVTLVREHEVEGVSGRVAEVG